MTARWCNIRPRHVFRFHPAQRTESVDEPHVLDSVARHLEQLWAAQRMMHALEAQFPETASSPLGA
jgi:predicted component of type VI protein secretion system